MAATGNQGTSALIKSMHQEEANDALRQAGWTAGSSAESISGATGSAEIRTRVSVSAENITKVRCGLSGKPYVNIHVSSFKDHVGAKYC